MLAISALPVLLIGACSAFFYRAAKLDGYSGILWGGGSILVSLAVHLGLGYGLIGILLGQLGFFGAITLYRVLREP